MALNSFRQARRKGYEQLWLESPTAHVRRVRRLFDRAHADCPVEGNWLGRRLLKRTLEEYDMADVIVVTSEYVRESFLAEGLPESKLRRRHLRIDRRFVPRFDRAFGGFKIVYIGSLCVTKGIAVLLEAFSRLADPQAQLTLVGGSGSRGMRRYLERWLARDGRIRIAPGDPFPYLSQAQVCVHASYQDGFGLAPMEALACGVPVIVTEDTGMKEHVIEGMNGYVVPTGRWEPILERLDYLRARYARARSTGSDVVSTLAE
jgi:glycosyltransferase involved in cell wall biosynthesis